MNIEKEIEDMEKIDLDKQKPTQNLKSRILTSSIMIVILSIALSNSLLFYTLMCIISVISAFEWQNITKNKNIYWTIAGIMIITIPSTSIYCIWQLKNGIHILLWLIATVAFIDITAFFAGKTFQGPKLIPIISPKKTWSGFIAALITSTLCGVTLPSIFFKMDLSSALIIGFILTITSQGGDLLESYIKRRFNVKDSGTILPGHGGILDRVDSYIISAPYILIISLIYS